MNLMKIDFTQLFFLNASGHEKLINQKKGKRGACKICGAVVVFIVFSRHILHFHRYLIKRGKFFMTFFSISLHRGA